LTFKDFLSKINEDWKGIIMNKLQKTIIGLILLTAFLPVNSNAGVTWTGSGHYQIGGEFGYPNVVEVNTFDTVTVTMVEGGSESRINMYDSSHLDMDGGDIGDELNLYENATASLFGASYIGDLWVEAASTGWVKLYAYNVIFMPSAVPEDGGGVVGRWNSNNQWFDIQFKGDRTQGEITKSFIQIVPEPTTLALLALGSLALLRRRQR
jgi:hypothetical protein